MKIKLWTGILVAFLLCVPGIVHAETAKEEPAAQQGGSFALMREDVEQAIAKALEEEDVGDRVKAEITNIRAPELFRYHHPLTVEIKTLKYSGEDRHFNANLMIRDGEEVITAMPITGRYEALVTVPVLKARFGAGDVIAAEDIGEMWVPASRLRKDSALSAAHLIGKTPRRVISPDRPIRVSELKEPDIIEKGATLTMRYHTLHMTITTVGEAEEPGAKGDTIRVRNLDSKMSVKAEIVSANEVQVGQMPRQMASKEE